MVKSITQWLDETAIRLPDKIAFATDKEGELTFANLCDASRRIGSKIAENKYFKQPIVIIMDKTPQCVVAMLGCTYANCPFVPIDVDNPPERVAKIIDKLQPSACITTEKYRVKFKINVEILIYDEIVESKIDKNLLTSVHRRQISTDLLYIIFTSGSTGTPKGVAISHANYIDYALQISETFGFDENTVFGQSVPFFFDPSLVFYMSQVLLNGCTSWIISKTTLMFPNKTIDFLNTHKCNVINWVATSYNIISKSKILDKHIPEHLQMCFICGEAISNATLNIWRRVLPNTQFVNILGPTEITGTFVYYIVDREFADDDLLPVGKPYANCDVFLLSEDNAATADGEIGEMCVRGCKVSCGYWNDPQKTAEVFIQNPLNPHYKEVVYKTGDLAYINEHGEFVFAGRRDFQIKHAGHRIELGEIEICANGVSGVELCACVFDASQNVIVLFYVGSVDEKTFRETLKGKLQDYMVPDRFVKLDAIPRTGSGKINRVELKERL